MKRLLKTGAAIAIIAILILAISSISCESRMLVVEMDDPIVVAQNEMIEYNKKWGYFQFPKLYYSTDGMIVCKIAYHEDSVEKYSGDYIYFGSNDGGQHWNVLETEPPDYSLLMDNGTYYQGPVLKDAAKAGISVLDGNDIIYSAVDGSIIMYYSYMLDNAEKYTSFESQEYDALNQNFSSFISQYNWDYVPVKIDNELVYPAGIGMYPFKMHTSGSIIKENSGSLYAVVYCWGGNEDGVIPFIGHCNIYCFRSTDNARTWNYVSSIMADQKSLPNGSQGLMEPCVCILPDSSYYMVIRTGTGLPCFYSRSYDNGNTWTHPKLFAKTGVAPQLLTMTNGVTIAAYGRPGIYIRVTDDAHAKKWLDEIPIKEFENDTMENTFSSSCSYTSLIEIDKNTALIAYSNFNYPANDNVNSDTTKTIVVRKIHIKYENFSFLKNLFAGVK